MKPGDKVLVTDSSYARRIDVYIPGLPGITQRERDGDFTLLETCELNAPLRSEYSGNMVHDIIIRSNETDAVYLHSSSFVKVAEPPKCECCGRPL
jgi:hypothetical protein